MADGLRESKVSARRIAAALRRNKAIEMRLAGKTLQEIVGAGLGYRSTAAVAQDIQRALAAYAAEPTAEMRTLELARLDRMWTAVLAVLEREHVTVSNGKVIILPGADTPLLDDGPVLQAVDRLLKIQERRAKLLGLDAPAKLAVISDDDLDREEARLAAELAELERAAAEAGTDDPDAEEAEG